MKKLILFVLCLILVSVMSCNQLSQIPTESSTLAMEKLTIPNPYPNDIINDSCPLGPSHPQYFTLIQSNIPRGIVLNKKQPSLLPILLLSVNKAWKSAALPNQPSLRLCQ